MDGIALSGPALALALNVLRTEAADQPDDQHALTALYSGLITLEALLGSTALAAPVPIANLQAAAECHSLEEAVAGTAAPGLSTAAPEVAPVAEAPAEPTTPAMVWTDERRAELRRVWPLVSLYSGSEILRLLNDLPGPTVKSPASIYYGARLLGLPTSRMKAADRAAAESPAAAAEPEPDPAGPAPTLGVASEDLPPLPPPRWSEARKLLLQDLWPRSDVSRTDIAARLTALPGPPINADQAYGYGRGTLRLPPRQAGTGFVAPPPTPPVVRPPAAADTQRDRDRLAVRELLAAGQNGRAIADELRIPLSDVANWTAQWRDEQAAARATRACGPAAPAEEGAANVG